MKDCLIAGFDYSIIGYPGAGMMLTDHPKYGRQLWVSVKLRVHKNDKCAICDQELGKEAYRPMTNLGNRYARICMESHL